MKAPTTLSLKSRHSWLPDQCFRILVYHVDSYCFADKEKQDYMYMMKEEEELEIKQVPELSEKLKALTTIQKMVRVAFLSDDKY